jgi:hypothetical protein
MAISALTALLSGSLGAILVARDVLDVPGGWGKFILRNQTLRAIGPEASRAQSSLADLVRKRSGFQVRLMGGPRVPQDTGKFNSPENPGNDILLMERLLQPMRPTLRP